MKNNWFKIVIAICAVAFVIIYYMGTQVGRYYIADDTLGEMKIFDTATGDMHILNMDGQFWANIKLNSSLEEMRNTKINTE